MTSLSKLEKMMEYKNVDFLYNYTNEYLKNTNDGLDRINQKLVGVIGFTAVLVKFAGELNNNTLILTQIKISAICFLILAFLCTLIALQSKFSGDTVSPEELAEDEWFNTESQRVKLFVVKQWINTIEQLEVLAEFRSKLLNWAFIFIGIATLSFAVNYVVYSLNPLSL